MIGSAVAVIAIVPSLPEIPISCDKDHRNVLRFSCYENKAKQEMPMPIVRDPLEPKISLWHLLAFYLRFLRERAGLSLTQCGKIIGVTRSTVSNIEAGRQRPQEDQLVKLDEKYGTGRLLQLLLWFARNAHDPDWGRQFLRYEEQADALRLYHGKTLPRPFQTEDYMRALAMAGRPQNPDDTVARLLARQQVLLDPEDPPFFYVILDEEALRACVGGPEVMRAQLTHLRKMMDLPNVIIRFIPPSAGAHEGFDGPFQIISMESRDIAYAGAQYGGRLIEAPNEIRDLWATFDRIGAKALPEDASRALVEHYLEQYT
ncbi:helix-turn-helix domain-containing protein [Actinomadura bangladeshensis]|uniref:Transcriptional regulator n=1 Tax=Actinomadura bangladeshensis TaxID=453573 RepID=A0A4R4NHV3_9ACTN|nr:helix-turn-helix transcriptional regulator [Actinomadura bangladeshensis]TDC07190.1 transcriptional regulator [Actinomadura bangladeshensis]